MNKRLQLWITLILFGFSMVFHSLNLDFASYELDEAVHLWFAQQPYSEVIKQASNDPNPPIYNLIMSVWVKNFGVTEFSTRFFSVLMGSLTVVVMFLAASRYFGLTTGLAAALFLCFAPIVFRFTHMSRPYTLMLLTVTLSYAALFAFDRKMGRWHFFWYWLTTTLMIYAHPTSIFNVPAQFLILLYYNWGNWRNTILKITPLVLAVFSFAVWVLAIPYFERTHEMWFGPPGFEQIQFVIRTFYGGYALFWVQFSLLFVMLVVGFAAKKPRSSKNLLLALIIWAVVPFITSIVFSYIIKPIFQDKYIMSVLPGMMLLLAVSISKVISHRGLRLTMFGLVICLLASSIELKPAPYGGDWKGLVNYIKPKLDEKTAVFIAPGYEYRTFAYYFDKSYYEDYSNTIGLLANSHVYTGWDNIVEPVTGEVKYDKVFSIHAHKGFVPSGIPESHVDSQVWPIGARQFPALDLRVFVTEEALSHQTLIRQEVDSAQLDENLFREFEDMFATPALKFYPDSISDPLAAEASVTIKQPKEISSLEDVYLVLTVQNDRDSIHSYNQVKLSEGVFNQQLGIVKNKIAPLDSLQRGLQLRAYLFNPSKIKVKYKELKLTVIH